MIDAYYEQCRLLDPSKERILHSNKDFKEIRQLLETTCSFDAYLEDEDSIETLERLQKLELGTFLHDVNGLQYYKGFGRRDKKENNFYFSPEGFGFFILYSMRYRQSI